MTSPIEIKCWGCGKSFKVGVQFAGKKGKCPVCGKVINVPDPNAVPESSFGVNEDAADHEQLKQVAHSMAMGPGGGFEKPKKGFFARLFRRK